MTRSVLLALLAACASTAPAPSSAPAPSNTAVDPPAKQEPATSVLAMDGKHVAAERVYEGRCAPKGSRGGCITITLRPDGTYKNFLYDAGIEGTYSISDHTLTLEGPTNSEHMTFSPDYEKLDDLALKH